jgi:hypothetical protein
MAGAGEVTLSDARAAAEPFVLSVLPAPSVWDSQAGSVTPIDFPTVPLVVTSHSKVKVFVDVIMDVESYDKALIKTACGENRFHDLPEPIGLKTSPGMPYKLEFAIIQQVNGKHLVFKIISMEDVVKQSFAKALCYGEASAFRWGADTKAVRKAIHFMFENMGGFQCRWHFLGPARVKAELVTRTEEEWDEGFDYIESKGPRDQMGNKQLRWITKELAREGSPIHKWPVVLVEKSLRHLSADGVLAEVHTAFPLTLKDLDPRILEMLKAIVPKLVDHALGLHGEPGAGKTPLARVVAMALSRWWIKNSLRTRRRTRTSRLPSARHPSSTSSAASRVAGSVPTSSTTAPWVSSR